LIFAELTGIVEHQVEASLSGIHHRIVHTRRNTINAKNDKNKGRSKTPGLTFSGTIFIFTRETTWRFYYDKDTRLQDTVQCCSSSFTVGRPL